MMNEKQIAFISSFIISHSSFLISVSLRLCGYSFVAFGERCADEA